MGLKKFLSFNNKRSRGCVSLISLLILVFLHSLGMYLTKMSVAIERKMTISQPFFLTLKEFHS